MKKIFSLFLAALLLSGCSLLPRRESPDMPVTNVAPIGVQVTVKVQNSHDYFSEGEPDDKDRLFNSYDELTEFIENTVAPNYPNGVPSYFYDYDEEFFETHSLFYTATSSSSGSVEYLTDKANAYMFRNEDGKNVIEITVPTYIPEVGTDDMAYFCIFAELKKVDENTEVNLCWWE